MADSNGWIKLHRKLLDNPIVMKDSEYLAVWIYLLLNASHAEYPVLFGGKKITLQPGQLITGRKSIASTLCISESKVTRILESLKSEHLIEQQTSNKNRLVSIVNWEHYQQSEHQIEQQPNNNRTTTEQQLNTNKKNKKIKKIKEDKEFTDYDALDTIVIGICGGDGIGPIITKESERVLAFLLKDEVASGKVKFKEIDGLTMQLATKQFLMMYLQSLKNAMLFLKALQQHREPVTHGQMLNRLMLL